MAITKLWSRRKDENRASSSIVAETIEYACNQEKTKNLEVTLIDDEFIDDNDVMENVLKYVVKEDKTKIKNGEFAELEEVFVSGVNCRTETADDEFMQVNGMSFAQLIKAVAAHIQTPEVLHFRSKSFYSEAIKLNRIIEKDERKNNAKKFKGSKKTRKK